MDQNEDWAEVCAYFRRNDFDFWQANVDNAWGPAWTFAPNCPAFAAKAGQQARRMGVTRLRHACRARLRDGGVDGGYVVVITELPERKQTIISLDGVESREAPITFDDEAMAAFATALGVSAHTVQVLNAG